MSTKPAIKFYTALSPNGFKVGIALEELGLPYECIAVNLPELEHKEEWFLKINPNGRIPALTDTLADGTSINLWETACILQYLIDRYDTEHKFSYPRGTKEYYQTSIWLSFQIASIGPIQGQAFHFCHYNHATTPQDYAVDRYVNELRRCYRVMDTHLAEAGSPYLVGDKPTVADWAVFPWASSSGFATVDLVEFPKVVEWFERMKARPAVQRGMATPIKIDIEKIMADPERFKEYVALNEQWIRKLMIKNREK